MKLTKKQAANYIIRIVLFYVVSYIVSIGTRVIEGILRGEHGAPSFVTSGLGTYAAIMHAVQIIAYIILGCRIPIKNRILKGLTFMFLFWISAYLPQVLGMGGAESQYLNPDAMSVGTILADSFGYVIKGILIGTFLTFQNCNEKRECSIRQLMKSSLVSMIVFPTVMFVFEMLFGLINPEFTCVKSFGIQKIDYISFYLVFYLFQAVSGFLFPIVYRFTELNSSHDKKWLIFASVYGWMLWTPVVLVVYYFGIPLMSTIAFSILMLITIYIDTYIYCRFLK